MSSSDESNNKASYPPPTMGIPRDPTIDTRKGQVSITESASEKTARRDYKCLKCGKLFTAIANKIEEVCGECKHKLK